MFFLDNRLYFHCFTDSPRCCGTNGPCGPYRIAEEEEEQPRAAFQNQGRIWFWEGDTKALVIPYLKPQVGGNIAAQPALWQEVQGGYEVSYFWVALQGQREVALVRCPYSTIYSPLCPIQWDKLAIKERNMLAAFLVDGYHVSQALRRLGGVSLETYFQGAVEALR